MSHRHTDSPSPMKIASVAAIAAAIGAAVAMLVSPRSGQENREALKRRAEAMKDKTVQTVDDAQDVNDSMKDRLQSTASKVAEDVRSTADKVKDDTKAAMDDEAKAAKRTAKRASNKDE